MQFAKKSLLPADIKVAWLFLVGVDALAPVVVVELVDLDEA